MRPENGRVQRSREFHRHHHWCHLHTKMMMMNMIMMMILKCQWNATRKWLCPMQRWVSSSSSSLSLNPFQSLKNDDDYDDYDNDLDVFIECNQKICKFPHHYDDDNDHDNDDDIAWCVNWMQPENGCDLNSLHTYSWQSENHYSKISDKHKGVKIPMPALLKTSEKLKAIFVLFDCFWTKWKDWVKERIEIQDQRKNAIV